MARWDPLRRWSGWPGILLRRSADRHRQGGRREYPLSVDVSAQGADRRCASAGISGKEHDSILKPNTSYKLAWVPDGAPIPALMVVPLPMGPEKIDQRRYLDLMTLRLSDLLERQEDPEDAARLVAREFDRAGLAPMDVRTHSSLACAMDLIEDNLMFRTWLRSCS